MADILGSRRLRYLLTALLLIAASGKPVSGKKLSEKMLCQRRYLEPDLQSLVQNQILESRRGAHGGYVLARHPQRITLLDIIGSLDNGDAKFEDDTCCAIQRDVILKGLEEAQAQMFESLSKIHLSDWLEEASAKGLLQTVNPTPDFVI